ncbi:MAG: tyrosine-type recombinase/integrase, partial [Halopenitus sp.]
VRRWWRVFRNLLRDAHADGYLERDLTRRVPRIETGRHGVRTEETLTVDELRDVVDAAREETPKRAAEIITLSYTGMRSGELWALHREDVDHERGSIHIHRSVSDGEVVDRTKTDVDRHIPMHPIVSEAIREHRKLLIRRQHDGLQSELVFPSDEGTPRYPGSLRKAFATITEAIGLDKHVSPQVLRRTFVTLMRTAQIDSIVSRSIVGHESEEMQEHYSRPSVEQKRDALDSIFTAEGG